MPERYIHANIFCHIVWCGTMHLLAEVRQACMFVKYESLASHDKCEQLLTDIPGTLSIKNLDSPFL